MAVVRPGEGADGRNAARATLYIGVAETDRWLEPGETERLRDALEAAERHWQRLPGFLAQHLSPWVPRPCPGTKRRRPDLIAAGLL